MRTNDVLPAIAGGTRSSIGINEYDFGIHLITCRCGIVELDIICSSNLFERIFRGRMRDYDGEVALCATKFGDKQPWSEQL